ncbi:MAG: hypothetical protein ABFD04_04660, partial [Syntrophomonas sp.]
EHHGGCERDTEADAQGFGQHSGFTFDQLTLGKTSLPSPFDSSTLGESSSPSHGCELALTLELRNKQ